MSSQETIDSQDSSIITNSDGSEVTIIGTNETDSTTTTFSTEPPKKKKQKSSKKQPPKKSPELAKDKPKELHAIGKFYAGIAELKVEKSDLEFTRTQRIIFEENGIHYEYICNKPPY